MATEAALHGAAPSRTHVAPLPSAYAARPPAPPPSLSPPTVLFASRLTPEKGVWTLLEAFGLMRTPAGLELAGAGIAAPAVARATAAHRCADRIRLLGHLEGAAMREAYARAAVVAVPSLWPEPFGLVGVEALASGRPVVTTGVGGITDWAQAELGVAVVAPGSAAALAAALDRVLAEPVWAARARDAGASWVQEHHSAAAHAARLREVLAPLTASRSAA
jgi:glycosyltransferase involved in cell wall biosynthesis